MKKRKHILFVGYWDADDGLTSSTILPNLRILKSMPEVGTLYFANVQREIASNDRINELKEITNGYFPLVSRSTGINIVTKLIDFVRFPNSIGDLCLKLEIDLVIARGAPAGAIAWLAWRKTGIHFAVESFEPHAEYMRLTGTWKRFDLRYIFQNYWEKQQRTSAQSLVVVSNNYRNLLLKEGIPAEKIQVAPCAVDPAVFFPDDDLKTKNRKLCDFPIDSVVGVYAGKFGGLYEDSRAFEIFKECFVNIPGFRLLLLTSHEKQFILNRLLEHDICPDKVKFLRVPHHEMNGYLNVADFGFALYKSTPVSFFLSPVKLAEYWAVGLPVILTDGIGDDTEFLENEGMGAIYRRNMDINALLRNARPGEIRQKALARRSFEKVKESYKRILT